MSTYKLINVNRGHRIHDTILMFDNFFFLNNPEIYWTVVQSLNSSIPLLSYFHIYRDFSVKCNCHTLGKIFSRQHTELFFLFFPGNKIRHFMQTVSNVSKKCQILFSGKNKKNIINLLSAEFAQRVLKVNSLD